MSATLLDNPQVRDAVLERVEEVEQLTSTREHDEQAPAHPATQTRAEWRQIVENAVLDVANILPAGTEDYEIRQLLYYLIELRQAMDDDQDERDSHGLVALATLKMADVAARLRRRLQHSQLEAPEAAAAFVFQQLQPLTATELAELLGVSARTVGAWKAGKPVRTNINRVVLVARLVAYLRPSMTARGVQMWFADKHDRLRGARPIDLLEADSRKAVNALIELARGERGQLAD